MYHVLFAAAYTRDCYHPFASTLRPRKRDMIKNVFRRRDAAEPDEVTKPGKFTKIGRKGTPSVLVEDEVVRSGQRCLYEFCCGCRPCFESTDKRKLRHHVRPCASA